ncbi:hypothetical protein BDV27DRAFT_137565, partial [Aspergillus caelatus]
MSDHAIWMLPPNFLHRTVIFLSSLHNQISSFRYQHYHSFWPTKVQCVQDNLESHKQQVQ